MKRGKKVLRIFAICFGMFILLCAAFSTAFLLTLPSIEDLETDLANIADQTTILFDKNGEACASVYGSENRIWVDIEDLPQNFLNAVIAIEDIRFYSHPGVDLQRILGAIWADIKAGAYVEGASTITQQLIKTSHLTSDKTITRKLSEAVLAVRLEQKYSKDDILEMYVNYVYYGDGCYGVQSASLYYFGCNASELTLAQSALLAGVINAPSYYAPTTNPDECKNRRDLVLSQMLQYNLISETEYEDAIKEPIVLSEQNDSSAYGWFVDAAMDEASELLGIDMQELYTGGYRIYTTLDQTVQNAANAAYEAEENFPEPSEDGTCAQSACVVLDSQTGGVSAIIGGRQYEVRRGLNRAISLKRQPGSVIKPILVYGPALASSQFSAASTLQDEPKTFGNYTPENIYGKYYGTVTMRFCVTHSLNVPAVEVMQKVGIDYCKAFAEQCGIPFEESDQGLSLALGGFTTGISPMQLAGAYGMIAANGVYHEPYFIERIENAQGEVLYQHELDLTRVLSSANAFILTDMLRGVINEGTGSTLKIDGIPLAGKTGTNGYDVGNRDAWMAAYNSEYTAVCWMGYDTTDETHHLPSNCMGGTHPAKILQSIYSQIYQEKSAPEFTVPEDVLKVSLDENLLEEGIVARAGEGAEGVDEYFDLATMASSFTNTTEFAVSDFSIQPNSTGLPVIRFTQRREEYTYRLLRSTGSTSVYTEIARWEQWEGAIEFIDATAKQDTAYTYYVEAYPSKSPEASVSSVRLFYDAVSISEP